MIISASRRTDIPAWFGAWFSKRIEAGYFCFVNPFNAKQVKCYSLLPEDVDLFVFWTKNPKPFSKQLDNLDAKGYNYYFQFTLNDYPKVFEPKILPVAERIEIFRQLSNRVGKEKVIWRYDPIILSNITPGEYHMEKIYNIARRLQGYTNRLTISFLDFYGKTENRLRKLYQEQGIECVDMTKDINILMKLAQEIKKLGNIFQLEVVTCSEKVELESIGIKHGACIDAKLIAEVFAITKQLPRDKNQRDECQCAQSVDMGAYNTCFYQCTYCYANYSAKTIEKNRGQHYLDSPTLVGHVPENIRIVESREKEI